MKRLLLVFLLLFMPLCFGQAPVIGAPTGTAPVKCVEDYLTSAMSGDYGQAINAANAAASLTKPTTLKVCVPGDHIVNTAVLFDRPIHFDMSGARLIPGSALASTPVTITNATVTAGSKVIAVSSTAGLALGMSVGGRGITYGSYITAIGAGNITVSLMPSLIVNGYVNGTTTVYTSSSLAGLATGQTVTGYGIPASTTISAVTNTEPQSLTLSQAANATLNTSSALTVSSGTWTVPTLTAVKTTPVITWGWNSGALQNEYGQMIGGSMRNVWIFNGTSPASVRTYSGLQGVQIYGWDGFNAYNTRVEGVTGSGVVIGGNVPSSTGGQGGSVRESYLYDTKIRYSGDVATGQPSLPIITPSIASDEINQIGFVGGQLATNFGETVTIGTYISGHTGVNGPRLLWFNDNFQVEGGQYLTAYPQVTSQADAVHIIQGDDSYWSGAAFNGAAFGKALFRIDTANNVDIDNSRLLAGAQEGTYTVGVTNGSTTVSWTSGASGFQADGSWDGVAAWLTDATLCPSGCVVHLAATNSVTSGTSLKLANAYTGTSTTATLLMPLSGYLANVTGALNQGLNIQNSAVYAADAQTYSGLSGGQAAYSQANSNMYVGQGPYNLPGVHQWASGGTQYLQALNTANFLDMASVSVSQHLAPNLSTGHNALEFLGTSASTNNALVTTFYNVGAGSASNYASFGLYLNANTFSFDGSGNLRTPALITPSLTASGTGAFSAVPNYGVRFTPTADTGIPDMLYGTNAANATITWHIDQSGNIFSAGNISAGNGSQTLYRCTTAGALPVGALTTATGNCGASVDTGLRSN